VIKLPVIVAQGGIGPAGRTSGYNAYHRLVFDKIKECDKQKTIASLSSLTSIPTDEHEAILDSCLVRRLHNNIYDPDKILFNNLFTAKAGSELILNEKKFKQLNPEINDWQVISHDDKKVKLRLNKDEFLFKQGFKSSDVYTAGQLPTGFKPDELYRGNHHPRGLAMTVFGASDALMSMGIDIKHIKKIVPIDQISVYAGSSMSQLDMLGNGGLLQSRLLGKRNTSKQLPLGFAEMPADFINAYIIESFGGTGTSMGACASFLYNLKSAIRDIQSGQARCVLVGSSEAPLTPDVISGYSQMGALATDKNLRELDKLSANEKIDHRRASRPFGENCGFTLAESAQFFILMDEELAIETGASILGGALDVFINADGNKKSITGPGVGNYITLAKAASLTNNIIGDKCMHQSFLQAHGSSTPQNRVTESHIMNQIAKAFKVDKWPVIAIKSRLGHSLASASGDQLMVALGCWHKGILPGIETIDKLADDVYSEHLNFIIKNTEADINDCKICLLNSKGFGGNNATGVIASPKIIMDMLVNRYGKNKMTQWRKRNDKVIEESQGYEEAMSRREVPPIYNFGNNIVDPENVSISKDEIKIGEYIVNLGKDHPYKSFFK